MRPTVEARSGNRQFFTISVSPNIEQLVEHIRETFPEEPVRVRPWKASGFEQLFPLAPVGEGAAEGSPEGRSRRRCRDVGSPLGATSTRRKL